MPSGGLSAFPRARAGSECGAQLPQTPMQLTSGARHERTKRTLWWVCCGCVDYFFLVFLFSVSCFVFRVSCFRLRASGFVLRVSFSGFVFCDSFVVEFLRFKGLVIMVFVVGAVLFKLRLENPNGYDRCDAAISMREECIHAKWVDSTSLQANFILLETNIIFTQFVLNIFF
jgi:hypothetical protein